MRSIRTSRAESGFTLLELLVGTTLLSLVLAITGAFFVASRNTIDDQILRIETQQGLRATMDTLVRDLRLGGACLPVNGSFVSLAGVNSGTTDTITTRTGLVQSDLSCVRTTLNGNLAAGSTDLPVASTAGFTAGMRGYIRNTDGTGEFFTISAVSGSTSRLSLTAALSQAYVDTSGVYSIDERTYTIDKSNPSQPVLTRQVNDGEAIPFAYGVTSLNVQYELLRNCDGTCDVVNLPANDGEWQLVNQVLLSVTVRSAAVGHDGQYYYRSGQVGVKPRNLLPGSTVIGH